MQRRQLLKTFAISSFCYTANNAFAWDTWGKSDGYPIGITFGLNKLTTTRVGNYSGGYEKLIPINTIKKSDQAPTAFNVTSKDISYDWRGSKKTLDEYESDFPITSLLICRDKEIFYEKYLFDRTSEMRMTSWSMAKSITSLLLGICIDEKLIDSYDDVAEKYVPSLKGTLHGSCTLRNLSNMSSGAQTVDDAYLYPAAFTDSNSDIAAVVSKINGKRDEQGKKYNYNEICPLTLGMVIRQVTNGKLSDYAAQKLWQPLGCEDDATWMTDSHKNEFNCIGFAARTRDWARVGNLIANRGFANGRQIISENWINEITSWSEKDNQCRFGVAGNWFGYKAHMWHAKADGSVLFFSGFHAQRVIVHMPSKTVIVQTALEHSGSWQEQLFSILKSAIQIQ